VSEFEFGFEFEFEFFFFVADATFGCYRTTLWCRRCCGGRGVLCVAWLRNAIAATIWALLGGARFSHHWDGCQAQAVVS
jgi:hypothetical protein